MTTDKFLLKNRFSANFHSYNSLAVVQNEICGQLAEMAVRICTEPILRGMEIGAGTGFLTRHLVRLYPDACWIVNDLAEESVKYLQEYSRNGKTAYLWGDAEIIDLPDGLDMMASASAIQWFDHTPEFIRRVFRSLNQGGYLALSTFGPDNFHEIKATTGEGLNYYTSGNLFDLLRETGFTIIENLEYIKQMYFDTPTDVLRHIKATGVNSLRKTRWTKQQLNDFETRYKQLFSSERENRTQVSLTYHPILIVAQKE